MHHISAASSPLPMSFVGVQHSHRCRRMDHNVLSQSVGFGVNSDISVGEDGFHLDECVFRQSYSFVYFYVASGILSY